MQLWKNFLSHFWTRHPALFIGLALLLGSALSLSFHWSLLFLLLLLIPTWTRLLQTLFLIALSFVSVHLHYPTHDLPKACQGIGYFKVSSLKISSSAFSKAFLYKGTLSVFEDENGKRFYNLPCSIYQPKKKNRPKANGDYILEGKLVQRGNRYFSFTPVKHKPWKKVESTFRLAEWRYGIKQSVNQWIEKRIRHLDSRKFLSALVTGDLDERLLSYHFGRLGMQHILAISGFHFALIALFFGFFLRLVLPARIAWGLLIVILTLYFFFLGDSPSIARAWIGAVIYLIAQIIHRPVSALNTLGIALILEIAITPLVVTHLGFQLSFLATAAILLLYKPMRGICTYLFPERSMSDVLSMPSLDRHAYLLGSFLRSSIALNLAVHIATIPVILYFFHKMPCLSLAYNLFYPLLVGLMLFFFLTAILLNLIVPPIGQVLLNACSYCTHELLELTSHPPAFLDITIRAQNLPLTAVTLMLVVLFCWGIWKKEHLQA